MSFSHCVRNVFRSYSSSPLIRVSEEGGIRRIVLADSKTKNSLTLKMVSSLKEAVTHNESDPSLRCIIISSEGSVFSSGFNLKELSDRKKRRVFSDYNSLMEAMVESPVPILSAVNGLAAAAGCQLVAQSDIALCTSTSLFSTPGAAFGVFCSSPGVPLVRCVGRKTAFQMLLTGRPISAEEALRAGLVSKVSSENEFEHLINEVANDIKSKSRSILELGKKFTYKQMEMNIMTAYEESADIMKTNLDMADGEEGLRSFMEKRKPVWKHVEFLN